jgi:hypothetical protein
MSDILLETLYKALGIKPRKENTAAEVVRTERLRQSGIELNIRSLISDRIRQYYKPCVYCGGSGVIKYEVIGGKTIIKPCCRCDGTGLRSN